LYGVLCRASAELRAEPPYVELSVELSAEPPYAELRAELRAELLLSFGRAPYGAPPKPYSAELL